MADMGHWKPSPFNLFWLPTEGELLRSVTCLPHSLSSEAATQQLWALAMNEFSHVLHSAALRLVFHRGRKKLTVQTSMCLLSEEITDLTKFLSSSLEPGFPRTLLPNIAATLGTAHTHTTPSKPKHPRAGATESGSYCGLGRPGGILESFRASSTASGNVMTALRLHIPATVLDSYHSL